MMRAKQCGFWILNFTYFSTVTIISVLVLFTCQGLIIAGAYKNEEFPVLVGLITMIMGIFSPRPKTTSGKGDGTISAPRVINFCLSAGIHIELVVFCLVVLIGGFYEDRDQLGLWIGIISTIIGIYVSRPKYKPAPTSASSSTSEPADDMETTHATL